METKAKLRQTIKRQGTAITELVRRIEKLERPYPIKDNEATISIPVVDSAGVAVTEIRPTNLVYSYCRVAKTRSISLERFVQELEEDLDITICWEQNTDTVVVYTRGET